MLNSILAHFTTGLFGGSLWALRLPALTFGVLQIPAAWLAGRLLYDRRTGMLAGGLVAVSSALTAYSVNARGYSFVALCGLVLLSLAALMRTAMTRRSGWHSCSIAALGLWPAPVMLFPIAFVAGWLRSQGIAGNTAISRITLRRTLLAGGLALGLALLLYSPVLIFTGPRLLFANRFVTPLSLRDFLTAWPPLIASTAGEWTHNAPLPLIVLLGFGLILGVAEHRRLSPSRIPPIAGLAGPLALATLQRVAPQARIWSILLPFAILIVAAGLVAGWRHLPLRGRARGPLGVALACLMLLWLGAGILRAELLVSRDLETESMPHGEQIAAALASSLRPGDVVASIFPSVMVVRYELRRAGLLRYYVPASDTTRRALVVVNSYRSRQTLEQVLDKTRLRERATEPAELLLETGPVRLFAVPLRQ